MIQISSDQKKFIKQNIQRDTQELALRGVPFFIIEQIKSRQKAIKKLPSLKNNYDLIFPKPLSIEQSSSEKTAHFKSSLVTGKTGIDLTGGFGVDTIYFAERFENFIYNDQDEDLKKRVEYNFNILNINNVEFQSRKIDVNYEFNNYDFIYLDPSRRSGDKKVFKLEDCLPCLVELQDKILKYSKKLMIKLSPLIDINHLKKSLIFPYKLYCLKYQNEVKELLLLSSDSYVYYSVDLDNETIYSSEGNYIFSLEELEGDFLFISNGSMNKLELSDKYASEINFSKINNTNIYIGEKLPNKLLFGRYFRIKSILDASSSILKKYLLRKEYTIITKNYPITASQVRSKYKVLESDKMLALIFKENQQTKMIIAEKI